MRGKSNLDSKLAGYNAAATFSSWFVLRDLDHDAECAPELLIKLLGSIAPGMTLRIPVRSLEAWLMADVEAIAEYLAVSRGRIPQDVESLEHPKRELVKIARRSRRRAIRQEMVPGVGVSAIVGPGYTGHVVEFVQQHWSPERAAARSLSLQKCISALRSLPQVDNE